MKKAGLLLMLAAVCFQGLAQTAKIKSCSIAPDNDDDMLTVKVYVCAHVPMSVCVDLY